MAAGKGVETGRGSIHRLARFEANNDPTYDVPRFPFEENAEVMRLSSKSYRQSSHRACKAQKYE